MNHSPSGFRVDSSALESFNEAVKHVKRSLPPGGHPHDHYERELGNILKKSAFVTPETVFNELLNSAGQAQLQQLVTEHPEWISVQRPVLQSFSEKWTFTTPTGAQNIEVSTDPVNNGAIYNLVLATKPHQCTLKVDLSREKNLPQQTNLSFDTLLEGLCQTLNNLITARRTPSRPMDDLINELRGDIDQVLARDE